MYFYLFSKKFVLPRIKCCQVRLRQFDRLGMDKCYANANNNSEYLRVVDIGGEIYMYGDLECLILGIE